MTASTRNICKEPDELVAIRISGISKDGAYAREYIVDGYVPLLKLYDCKSTKKKYSNTNVNQISFECLSKKEYVDTLVACETR